jgi:very-short-patch-repair endonuclease
MLNLEKTLEDFGYGVDSLSKGSSKKIIAICDYCKNEYTVPYKQYLKSRSVVEKDACIKCKYKKREDISLAQYGVKNSAQRDDVRKKISENCEGFDEKRRDIMRKKYGVSNPMESDELRERHKQSVLDKYGVENVSQIKEVREKVEQTNLERFGNKQFLASDVGREKIKEGMVEKYGVENAFQSEEIKNKIKETNLQKYGVDHHLKDKERAKANVKKVIDSKIKRGSIKTYEGKTISEWRKSSEYSDSRFRVLINKHGFDIAKTMTPRFSSLEQIFEKWLIEQKINYKKQFAVENRCADFLLVDYNIIIELDGLYWHSEVQQPDYKYHVDKHKLYVDHGYIPLFFREDEINNKFDIIKSIILNKMNKSNRIFARKCDIIMVNRETSKTFFEQNHLMGKGRGITYGLTYNGELLSCIIIRKTRQNNYEISRFCHKIGYQVIGGFSRLIKHFLRQNNAGLLTTFIDRRYGAGDYLKDLGFKSVNYSPSFVWTNGTDCVHRMRFPGNTGYSKGFIKLWDCGQARYDLQT